MKNQSILFKIAFLFSGILFFFVCSNAQSGSLDLSFGNAGKVITDIASSDAGKAVAIQADGKILVAGSTKVGTDNDFALIRYHVNGTLDNSFGNNGAAITDINGIDYGYSVAIQADGKIVVAGRSSGNDVTLVRYLSNGTLDTTFGFGGKVTSDIAGSGSGGNAVAIQSDGKIIVAGGIDNGSSLDVALLRYKTNGTLDSSFANAGVQITDNGGTHEYAQAMALQNDGKIVIAAYHSVVNGNGHMMVLRYNTNGMLDSTFGNGGMQITVAGVSEQVYSVAIQNDGKIVAGGSVVVNIPFNGDRDFMLIRYHTNGQLDNTFGNGGIAVTHTDSSDWGYAMDIQQDGRILIGGRVDIGSSSDFILACYNTNGSPDTTFGNAGIAQTDIAGFDFGFALAIQNDNKVVLVGNGAHDTTTDYILARYHYGFPEGVSSVQTQNQELNNYPNPFSSQTTLQLNADIHNATLIIYNIFGQPVKKINHLSGNEIKLNRDDLPSGFYSVQLVQECQTLATGRMLIRD